MLAALQRLPHVEMVEKQRIHGPKLQERKTASRLLPHPLRHTGFEFGFDLRHMLRLLELVWLAHHQARFEIVRGQKLSGWFLDQTDSPASLSQRRQAGPLPSACCLSLGELLPDSAVAGWVVFECLVVATAVAPIARPSSVRQFDPNYSCFLYTKIIVPSPFAIVLSDPCLEFC